MEVNLNAVVDPKIKIEQLVQVPAEAVLFDRSDNAQQPGIFKKFTQHGFIVNAQFHHLVV